MISTPRHAAGWGADPMASPFGSPASDTSSEASTSTSTLQYVNSQLVAHGFSRSPGLCLDGLSKDHGEQVVKCLMSLLSQRMEDVRRTEDLTTKFRTLSYDYERLTSMHRTSVEQAAAAEREMNLNKSRLAAANRSLQSEKAAHKHTVSELHRTRSSLQSVKQAHVQEIKRNEKETERILERWAKIADSQVKLNNTSAGLTFKFTCANPVVSDGGMSKGKGLLEQALEDAEEARAALGDENKMLRKVLLDTVNELLAIVHFARSSEKEDDSEPTPYINSTLFPMRPIGATSEKVSTLLQSLRDTIQRLMENQYVTTGALSPTTPSSSKFNGNEEEVSKLKSIVKDLRTELSRASSSKSDSEQRNEVERESLKKSKRELLKGKGKLKEAAAYIESEKEQLEREKAKFLDEKRAWQEHVGSGSKEPVYDKEQLPETAEDGADNSVDEEDEEEQEDRRPFRRSIKGKGVLKSPKPRRSSSKPSVAFAISVGKAGLHSNKRARFSLTPKSPQGVIPPFETEVIISTQPLIVPSTFVLPPPSPSSLFPERQDILAQPSQHQANSDSFPHSRTSPNLLMEGGDLQPYSSGLSIPMSPSMPNLLPSFKPPSPQETLAGLPSAAQSTPVRTFPVAKPLATRMIHAYSPARPSPLSRILMLGDSPMNTKMNVDIPDAIPENEEEGIGEPETEFKLAGAHFAATAHLPMTDDELDDSPLREKQARLNAAAVNSAKARIGAMAKQSRSSLKGDAKKSAVKSGKAKVKTKPVQKENTRAAPEAAQKAGTSVGDDQNKAVVSTSIPPVKGGPRRVPANSAEAAPMIWRN